MPEPAGERWPASPREWEERAAALLPPKHFDYIAGGAGEEAALEANRAAFGRRRLWPRVLAGHGEYDPSVELLGTRSPAPFMLAPVGVLELAHPDAERAVARAAGRVGVPMVVSSAASTPLEAIAAELGGSPWWFQLYMSDPDVDASLVRRAEAAGCSALVVTVDMAQRGIRYRDVRNDFPAPTLGIAQFTSDPVFRERLAMPPEEDLEAAGIELARIWIDPTWERLAELRELASVPVLLKGILHPDDALRAFEEGADGVIVSNHGGRQLDRAPATLDALPLIREEVGPERTLLLDGGVRSGEDVLCALALGAGAVLVGRPYVYGLAAGGEEGVEQVLRGLAAEVDVALALVGARSARELDSRVLAP